MDTPTRLHKLTALSQLLDRLRTQTLEAQNNVIKAAGEDDLRLMLLNRYPLPAAGHARHDGGGHPGAWSPCCLMLSESLKTETLTHICIPLR